MNHPNNFMHQNGDWWQQLEAVRKMLQHRFLDATGTFMRKWREFSRWISQPHIRKRITIGAMIVVFAAVFFGIPALGFGSAGIVGGSFAAAYQSAVYGGLTAGGSWFAFLTSVGMTPGAVTLLATAGAAIAGAFTWLFTGLLA